MTLDNSTIVIGFPEVLVFFVLLFPSPQGMVLLQLNVVGIVGNSRQFSEGRCIFQKREEHDLRHFAKSGRIS